MTWFATVVLFVSLNCIRCDYQCVCNYNDELTVYSMPSSTAHITGHMYQFDCKPHGSQSDGAKWLTVVYEHKLGYIEKNDLVLIQTCQGDLSNDDTRAAVTPIPQSSSSSPPTARLMTIDMSTIKQTKQAMSIDNQTQFANTGRASTTLSPTTITKQTATQTTSQTSATVATITQGHIELCPIRIQQLAMRYHGEILAQFGKNCYEVVQDGVSWSHAESICRQHGGHLIHIANKQEQDFVLNFLIKHHSHTVWIGLHDKNQEENFEWSSGNSVVYTNWKPGRKDYVYHGSEDCVYMIPGSGQWDDIQCGGDTPTSEIRQGHRHAYICQYATIDTPATTDPATVDGDIALCSKHLQQQVTSDNGTLGQYNNSCYELVPYVKTTWSDAESYCYNRGGHLAHIGNAKEQTFVQTFMHQHFPNHAVWIGLNDLAHEDFFQWSSGTAYHYTHWIPAHHNNYASHHDEDCVVFVPYMNGGWDDIPCGGNHHFPSQPTYSYPILCQYGTATGPAIVG